MSSIAAVSQQSVRVIAIRATPVTHIHHASMMEMEQQKTTEPTETEMKQPQDSHAKLEEEKDKSQEHDEKEVEQTEKADEDKKTEGGEAQPPSEEKKAHAQTTEDEQVAPKEKQVEKHKQLDATVMNNLIAAGYNGQQKRTHALTAEEPSKETPPMKTRKQTAGPHGTTILQASQDATGHAVAQVIAKPASTEAAAAQTNIQQDFCFLTPYPPWLELSV
jgi:hypothetical protein